jgi:hypothetical protein
MHRFRFSLLTLFGFVAVVAVACAALVRPSPFWLMVVSSATLALLFYAVLAAVYGRSTKRAFWTGFAVVAWGYVALEWAAAVGLPFFMPTDSVTNRLESIVHAQAPTSSSMTAASLQYLASTYSAVPQGAAAVGPLNVAYAAAPISGPADSFVYQNLPALPADTTAPVPLAGPATIGYAPSNLVFPYPLTNVVGNSADLDSFRQAAKWLWSLLLGFAGGFAALWLCHQRERGERSIGTPERI